jgi:hypothetical protein
MAFIDGYPAGDRAGPTRESWDDGERIGFNRSSRENGRAHGQPGGKSRDKGDQDRALVALVHQA